MAPSTVSSGRRPAVVDVIESSAYVLDAVSSRFAEHPALRVRARTSNWISYITEHPAPADIVIFRAELRDHVPAALKARTIAAAGSLPVVTAATEGATYRQRLRAEGAQVVERSAGLPALMEVTLDGVERAPRRDVRTEAPEGPLLTDRELQLACLYAGRSAPSAPHLAEMLGLSDQTVRAHLKRCRAKLSAAGWPATTREQLRASLERGGWLIPGT